MPRPPRHVRPAARCAGVRLAVHQHEAVGRAHLVRVRARRHLDDGELARAGPGRSRRRWWCRAAPSCARRRRRVRRPPPARRRRSRNSPPAARLWRWCRYRSCRVPFPSESLQCTKTPNDDWRIVLRHEPAQGIPTPVRDTARDSPSRPRAPRPRGVELRRRRQRVGSDAASQHSATSTGWPSRRTFSSTCARSICARACSACRSRAPVGIAPMGGLVLFHPEGDVEMARGAGKADTLQWLSGATGWPVEDVARAARGRRCSSSTTRRPRLGGRAPQARRDVRLQGRRAHGRHPALQPARARHPRALEPAQGDGSRAEPAPAHSGLPDASDVGRRRVAHEDDEAAVGLKGI